MGVLKLTKKASVVLPCDPGLVYEILTDYDSYVEWMPLVAHSKLLAREGDLAIAEFILMRPRQDRFVVECIHTRLQMVLTRIISGKLPVTQFEWVIAPAEEGRCEVTLTIERKTNWRWFVPAYRVFMNAAKCLHALQARISAFLPELVLAEDDGEKILELFETEEGMVCWIRGKKYALKPTAE